MRRHASLLALIAAPIAALSGTAAARDVVLASAPEKVSVTVYRDPNRDDRPMTLDWLNGFALVSETRTVTLPPGESTIRFDNVAESMVAVSAIVTGLPGGTIEKNRNAAILSPAALVDGTLGNRVTITRTNPATGAQVSESAAEAGITDIPGVSIHTEVIPAVTFIFLLSVMVHAVGDGLLAGVIQNGSIPIGMRHSFIMLLTGMIGLRLIAGG